MSLLTPDSGLLFWMLLSFGIVLVILSKFGFPVIVKAIEERKAYIDHSIESARQAEAQLAHIQAECAQRLEEAKAQQNVILREAYAEKERILEAARQEATHEGQRLIEEATRRIREEKAQAIREMRGETGRSLPLHCGEDHATKLGTRHRTSGGDQSPIG